MSFVNWKEEYSVGVKSIDDQHKKWIGIINKLHEAMKSRTSKEVIPKIFKEMEDYTKYHFKTEEKLFEKYGYPKEEAHKKVHKQFIKKLEDHIEDFNKGKMLFSIKLMDLIKKWLVEHILEHDMRYSSFLIKKGAK